MSDRTMYRVTLIWILITTCLCYPTLGWIGNLKNITNVAEYYSNFCGTNFLCLEKERAESSNVIRGQSLSFCPSCSCSDDCHVTGYCCPDKTLHSCVPTKYFVNNIGNGDIYYNIVSYCPLQRNESPAESCTLPIDQTNLLTKTPVTSEKTNVSYASERCAKCNGETDVIPWLYDIECLHKRLDLSVYSDPTELWADLQLNNCTIQFLPHLSDSLQPCNTESVIRECNFTGIWDIYDEDLKAACETYWIPYGAYQNVFCFLCNIGNDQRQQFALRQKANRNTTVPEENGGQSGNGNTNTSHQLEKTCTWNSSNEMGKIVYSDAEIILSETYNTTLNTFIANFTFLSINLQTKIKEMQFTRKELNVSSETRSVNITSLYIEYVKSGGYEDWCEDDHKMEKIYGGWKARRTCLCDQKCYKSVSCCPDAAYSQVWSCTLPAVGDIHHGSFIQNVFLISKCMVGYGDSFIKSMCENSQDFALLNVPFVNVQTNETYKNYYCYLCNNQNKPKENLSSYIKPWDITVACPHVFFPVLMTSLQSVLDHAKQNSCTLYFTTTHPVDTCWGELHSTIDKCNVTGLATVVSQNAVALCEDSKINTMIKSKNGMYRNVICDVCNSGIYEDPITKCNMTGTWKNNTDNSSIKDKCENGTLDKYFYPFKNMFCKYCNEMESGNDFSGSVEEIISRKNTYRQLFSMLDLSQDKNSISAKDCSPTEIYDSYQKKCRKLYCSPGKFLHQFSCIPVINKLQHLQYRLAFKVMISYDPNLEGVTLNSVLENLRVYLEDVLSVGASNVYVTVTQSHCYVQKPCHLLTVSQLTSNSDDEALVNLQIQIMNINGPIDRSEVEIRLLNFTEWNIQLHGITLRLQEDTQSWYLPIRRELANSQSECIHHKYQSSGRPSGYLHSFDVNKLLMCPQIQLESDEFTWSESHLQISIPAIKRNLFINEFTRGQNSTVRICSDSFKDVSELSSLVATALNVTTFICTIISLVCLFLTFLIYCILPVLRTVPGKNIMCFSLSLFFAQLMVLIRSHISNGTVCAFVGGLAHYFWVSVFTCANICCFQMFKLFVSNSLAQNDKSKDRITVLRYCFISFGLPVLPIALNEILKHFLTNGYKFGYGGSTCFLLSPLALFLTFILPTILQIIFNVVMFSVTFHYIRNTPKVQSSQNRNEFSIFLKLFLLTGTSWILMIVDGFFKLSPFTFLASLVNGSQGLFLFISYICNKKVLCALKRKLFTTPLQDTSSSPSMSTFLHPNCKKSSVYSNTSETTETLQSTNM